MAEPSPNFDQSPFRAEPSGLLPAPEEEERWRRQFDRLLDIRRLRENWDGEGARAVDPLTVDSVLELLRRHRMARSLPPPSRIGAAGDGTIVIEWQLGGSYYSLEVSNPDRGDWMSVSGGRITHWEEAWGPSSRPVAETVWTE